LDIYLNPDNHRKQKKSQRIANGDIDQLVNNNLHLWTHIKSALTLKKFALCKMTNVQHLGNQSGFQSVSEMYWGYFFLIGHLPNQTYLNTVQSTS